MKKLIASIFLIFVASSTLANEKYDLIDLIYDEFDGQGVGSYQKSGNKNVKSVTISNKYCSVYLQEISEWNSEFTLEATLLRFYVDGKELVTDLDYWDLEDTRVENRDSLSYSYSFTAKNGCDYVQTLSFNTKTHLVGFEESKECRNGYITKETMSCQL